LNWKTLNAQVSSLFAVNLNHEDFFQHARPGGNYKNPDRSRWHCLESDRCDALNLRKCHC